MTKLVFHIGDHKTGSSSIQRVLLDRHWISDEVDIAYPDQLSVAQMAKTLYKNSRREERDAKWREQVPFLKAAEMNGADMAVLSAEHFSHVDPALMDEAIRAYFPGHADTAHFIAYLRPHAGSLLSHYAQQTKCGTSLRSLERMTEQSVENGFFLMAPRIRAWKDRFGERLVLRPMIRDCLANGDVVQDFLQTLARGQSIQVTGASRTNESLTVQQLAAVREVQGVLRRAEVAPKMRVSVGQHLGNVLSRRGGMGGDPLRLPRELAEKIARAHREDAVALDDLIGLGKVFAGDLEMAPEKGFTGPQSNLLSDYVAAEHVSALRRDTRALVRLLEGPEGRLWKKMHHASLGQNPSDVPTGEAQLAKAKEVRAQLDAIELRISDFLS